MQRYIMKLSLSSKKQKEVQSQHDSKQKSDFQFG